MISKRVRCDSISPEGLRDSHILFNQIKGTTLLSECKRIAGGPFGKFGPTCAYGFWTRRFVIAIPAAEASRNRYQAMLTAAGYGPITTEIAPAGPFYYAEGYHQQYLAKNPNGYCGLGGTGVACPVGLSTASASE